MSGQHMIDSIRLASGLTPSIEWRGPSADRISAAIWNKSGGSTHTIVADANPDQHVISVIRSSFRAEMFFEGKLSWQRETRTGSINIVSAGREPMAHNTCPYDIFHLYLPARLVRELVIEGTRGRFTSVELIDPQCLDGDPALTACAREVEREMLGYSPFCSLRMDVLAQDAAIHLARRYSNVCWPTLPHRWPDPGDWRLRRVIDAIMADLSRDWRLADLAALVDLTPRHLTSLFRWRLGMPPHAWLIARRIELAQELLVATDRSILEIALQCGFSSAQHFATAFKAKTGAPPKKFRISARS